MVRVGPHGVERSHDHHRHPVPEVVGPGVGLAGELRRAVRSGRLGRVVLGHRHGPGACRRPPTTTRARTGRRPGEPGRLEEPQRGGGVHIVRGERVVQRPAQVHAGEVVHDVDVGQPVGERLRLAHVTDHELHLVREEVGPAGAQVVDHDHGPTARDELAHHGRAHEPGPARDEIDPTAHPVMFACVRSGREAGRRDHRARLTGRGRLEVLRHQRLVGGEHVEVGRPGQDLERGPPCIEATLVPL